MKTFLIKAIKSVTIILLAGILIFISCSEDKNYEKYNIQGFVQKGPFINGYSITIYELNDSYTATGKTFNAQIVNNRGSFTINNIELESGFVSLKADGFYYNEIKGEQSVSQVTLYAISDITDKFDINVNLLTHLEKNRTEYLINEGMEFGNAKNQAQSEVLNIFNIRADNINESETFDISRGEEGDAILLAVSLILQGYRTEGQLTELLSNISNDLREDGILDDTVLGSALINHAINLDTVKIRENLENRYNEVGVAFIGSNFGKYIQNFIENTDFDLTESVIIYPEEGLYGENILSLNKTDYIAREAYSLAAELPEGSELKIKISATSVSNDSINGEPTNGWFYSVSSVNNWAISAFNNAIKEQSFTAVESGKKCDLNMFFEIGEYKIEYFEMDSEVATRSKVITVN